MQTSSGFVDAPKLALFDFDDDYGDARGSGGNERTKNANV
jgi:hypothetical protein